MSKFETLKNHKLATGLVIFVGALTAFNAVGPLDDIKDDAMSGGGDFDTQGTYSAQTYFMDLDRMVFGGKKEFSCQGKKLILRDEVVNIAQTLASDNGYVTRDTAEKDLGESPACADGILTDSDAKYKFWRD